jgi:DNA-binding NarL/FixJ family response regulator
MDTEQADGGNQPREQDRAWSDNSRKATMSRMKAHPTRSSRKRVLIVDDHPLIRQGIRMLLERSEDLEVFGEAESAAAALEAMKTAQPDVATVDLSLRESCGLELIKDIRIRHPQVLVLVLSMKDEGFYAERALRIGARGYLSKEQGPEGIVAGIRKVLQGQICVSEMMASKVMSRIVEGGAQPGSPPVDRLSDRELTVLELIGKGLPSREIATSLHISPKTVDSHREHIKDKLSLGSATELLKYAVQWVQGRAGL